MPLPYSHLALAKACLPRLKIQDEAAYYLGALAPDLRYQAGISRVSSHIKLDDFLQQIQDYPDVKPDFVSGYLVHLICDEMWYSPYLRNFYQADLATVGLLKRRFTRTYLLDLCLELYCLREKASPLVVIEAQGNCFLEHIGISADCLHTALPIFLNYYQSKALLDLRDVFDTLPRFNLRIMLIKQALYCFKTPHIERFILSQSQSASSRHFERLVHYVLLQLELLHYL